MNSKTIGQLGEFEVIDHIRGWIESRDLQGDDVIVGLGDDLAVVRPSQGTHELLTTDVQVAGVHFIPEAMTAKEIGRRVFEVNLSDIIAKGGTPRWALISLGLTRSFPLHHLEQIYAGLLDGAEASKCALVGGNMAGVPEGSAWFIDLTLVGSTPTGQTVLRHGTRRGDILFATGTPGAAAAGLHVLRHALKLGDTSTFDLAPAAIGNRVEERDAFIEENPWGRDLIRRYVAPRARMRLGQMLANQSLLTAAMDISDGLIGDTGHLAARNGMEFIIDRTDVPIHDSMALAAKKTGLQPGEGRHDPPWSWLFGASDDYEMLFTAREAEAADILETGEITNTPIREVGYVVEGEPLVRVIKNGETLFTESAARAWDHFRPPKMTLRRE